MAGEAKKVAESVISAPVKVMKKMLTAHGLFVLTMMLVGNIAHAQMKKHWSWYRNLTIGA